MFGLCYGSEVECCLVDRWNQQYHSPAVASAIALTCQGKNALTQWVQEKEGSIHLGVGKCTEGIKLFIFFSNKALRNILFCNISTIIVLFMVCI